MRRLPLQQQLLVVLGLSCVALVASLLLHSVISPAIPFTAVVLVATWLFGTRPGLSAVAICATLAILFAAFLIPASDFGEHSGWAELVALVALNALLAYWFGTAVRRVGNFESVLGSMGDAIIITDRKGGIAHMNSQAEAMLGVSLKEACEKPLIDVVRFRERTDGSPVVLPIDETLRGSASAQTTTTRRLVLAVEKAPQGPPTEVEESMVPVRSKEGDITGAVLTIRDTTRKRDAEDQLSRSQKMDAIARLSGGLAGDFNNLLTVITGYGEMLRGEVPPASPARRFSDEILFAAERAAAVTRQLMALSRQQSGQTRLIDLNTAISSMQIMLQRLMGEKVSVMIMPGPGAGKIVVDPGQLEQAIVNLAMNARDAMPQGGNFVIETSKMELDAPAPGRPESLAPGTYILMSVSDTGVGMDAETRSRLFEPFFTTKGHGKSAGLGLSIVYGIVRRSGGDIGVYSQAGTGTVFEIYFPRAKDQDVETPRDKRGQKLRGHETILLADDDDGVRKLVHAILATSGYTVVEVVDGRDALAAYQADPKKFDLVLTDVVMPNLDGLALGDKIVEVAADQKILYMSGFRDSSMVTKSDPDRQRPFLQKPFTPDSLLTRVREMLDSGKLGAKA